MYQTSQPYLKAKKFKKKENGADRISPYAFIWLNRDNQVEGKLNKTSY